MIFKELDACILLLKYYLTHNKDDLLNLLDTKIISGYTDYNYIDLIKKSYLETNHLEDPFESKYNFFCVLNKLEAKHALYTQILA